MRLVPTRSVAEGAILGMDLPAAPGRAPLLRAGAELRDRQRYLLLGAGINRVYVEDEISAGIAIPHPLSERTRAQARAAVTRTFADAARMPGNLLAHDCLDDLMDAAKKIVEEISGLGEGSFGFADLAGAESYNVEHSIDVTIVGLLVGRRLFRTRGGLDFAGERRYDVPDDLLAQLGTGLFLQDIGKLALSPHLVHKPGPLEADEWELMQQHPLLGLHFLRDDQIGPRTRSVVSTHHERWDGGGYPTGLEGEDIPQFARIAAAADVFDALTSERWYAEASSQAAGVEAIREGAGSAFDPEVAEVFTETIAAYPEGTEIELADGRRGVVASVPADDINAPLVRLLDSGEEIDLARDQDLVPAGVAVPSGARLS
jgi:HD-GYP domain-containing protein (c-di-GMP phosphodiesterase class II)